MVNIQSQSKLKIMFCIVPTVSVEHLSKRSYRLSG